MALIILDIRHRLHSSPKSLLHSVGRHANSLYYTLFLIWSNCLSIPNAYSLEDSYIVVQSIFFRTKSLLPFPNRWILSCFLIPPSHLILIQMCKLSRFIQWWFSFEGYPLSIGLQNFRTVFIMHVSVQILVWIQFLTLKVYIRLFRTWNWLKHW